MDRVLAAIAARAPPVSSCWWHHLQYLPIQPICMDMHSMDMHSMDMSLLMDQVPVLLPMEPRLAPYRCPL